MNLHGLLKKENEKFLIINHPSIAVLISIYKCFFKVSFLLHVHEPITPIISNKSFFSRTIYKLMMKLMLKSVNEIIFVSSSLYDDYHSMFNISKYSIVSNPINLSKINILAEAPVKLDSHKVNFITVCRLTEAKGLFNLVKGFHILKTNGIDNFKLNILGDGELMSDLLLMVSDLGLNSNIELLGFVENPYSYIKNSDCYISSSLWEGFGLTILYAMLLKKPIISSKTKGAQELLTPSDSMYEVDDIQKLANLLEMFMVDSEVFSHSIFRNYEKSLCYDVGHSINFFKKSIDHLCQK
jgi:glycosyltransferase involved in cell wall biosynthesis